jgi:hypothetical protein
MKKSQKLPLHKEPAASCSVFGCQTKNVVFQCFCDCLLFVGSPGGGWVEWERLWNNVKFHLVPHLEECLAGDSGNSKFLFLGTSLNVSYLTWFELAVRPRPQGKSEPAPASAPSTGNPSWLSCGWTSTKLVFGFALVTHFVRSRSHT